MKTFWLCYIGGRLAGHIWLTRRDRRNYWRGYQAGEWSGRVTLIAMQREAAARR